jgi:hypothetical protein
LRTVSKFSGREMREFLGTSAGERTDERKTTGGALSKVADDPGRQDRIFCSPRSIGVVFDGTVRKLPTVTRKN